MAWAILTHQGKVDTDHRSSCRQVGDGVRSWPPTDNILYQGVVSGDNIYYAILNMVSVTLPSNATK